MTRAKYLVGLGIAGTLLGSSVARAGTTTFNAIADAHVDAQSPSGNFGTATRMMVDGSPLAATLLRFAVSGLSGSVSRATLRLYVNNPSDDGPAAYRTTAPWTEGAVTWASRPAWSGAALADLGAIATATWVELDVTAAVSSNATVDFALVTSSADGATFHSRETAQPPQLVVETGAPPPPPPPPPPPAATVDVTLQPRVGVTGTQRVNFAVPLARGQLADPARVRVLAGATELRAARRALARYADGSVRSVQLQVDADVGVGTLKVRLGEAPTTTELARVAVSTTLETPDGSLGPRVWVRLPAAWLSASGVVGPQVTEAAVEGTALDAFDGACDYANHTVTQFIAQQASKDVWLYDRGTTMYRGYARRGDALTLESAYRETAIYRNGLTGTGAATRIGVPGSAADLKYHYAQNMAIHYLLTGDERFRDSAEDVADRIASMWSPDYGGGDGFWTERHAGFALLAYVWAGMVSDDRADLYQALADDAVEAYLALQATYSPGWNDQAARCFAHTATAHGEDFGTWGCSPWMSAILADGLDQYATETGGSAATAARGAIVKLGTVLARDGRDSSGKPYYWMGMGNSSDEIDDYDEHWGEPAYVVAMAWHHGGRSNATLEGAARAMLGGLKSHGTSPHLRSFNWQCRSAPGAAYYLR
jgi:hypothetical protein